MYSINLPCGTTIDEALKILRDEAMKYSTFSANIICAEFNDVTLTSTMTDDEAYLAITGKTKAKYKQDLQDYYDSLDKKKQEYKERITSTITMYKEASKNYIRFEDSREFYKDLSEYLTSGYETFIIDCLFEVISIAKCGLEFNDIVTKIHDTVYKQGHSGNTAYQLYKLIRKYCPCGEEIANKLCPYKDY